MTNARNFIPAPHLNGTLIMIDPTKDDIGRKVAYTGNRYPGGKIEEGVITSFNDHSVFVRYGADLGSKATSREDLEFIPFPIFREGNKGQKRP